MNSSFVNIRKASRERYSVPNELSLLKDKIEQAGAVSFDFFDTLFVRPICDPEDAFDLLGHRFGIRDFRTRRRAAQMEAFRRMPSLQRKEITLKDIYACFHHPEVSARELLQAEYELELTLAYPNPELIDLFLALQASGKPVVVTSDMYLPVEFFTDAFRKHGLDPVEMFISADRNATKRDRGELFDVVVAELELARGEILHVGDNPLSDVKRAHGKGLLVHHYQWTCRVPQLKQYYPSASLAIGLHRAHSHRIPPNSYQELGFLYGGPAAVGFLDWIAEQAQRDSIDHILFVARDGYVLSRIATDITISGLPKFDYFWGSRVVFSLAGINENNFLESIPFLLSGADGLSPFELFQRIGVTPPAETVMQDLGLGSEVTIGPAIMERLTRLIFAFRWEILKICQQNRRALFLYLKKLGIENGNRVALVDIGWNGTTQEAFERAVTELMDIDVYGYYLCLANTPECLERRQTQRMRALISNGTASSRIVDSLFEYRAAAEAFFSAPHDSIIGLTPLGAGEVIPVEDPGRGETEHLYQIASDITSGMEAFARKYIPLRKEVGLEPCPIELVWPMVEYLTGPGSDVHAKLGAIKNFDGWASTRNRDRRISDY